MAKTYTYTARNAYDPEKWEYSFSSLAPETSLIEITLIRVVTQEKVWNNPDE